MIDAIRPILELVYFASGPLTFIVACIALYHLKIARDSARVNARRDSLRLAASQCDSYHRYIIPLINSLDDAVKNNGIVYFEKAEVDVEGDAIRVRPNLTMDELMEEQKKMMKITGRFTEAFNAIEAFAVFFVSGVADENVAFSSVGKTYCYTVRHYLPDVVPVLELGGHYRNMIKLFLMWNARLEKQKLLKDKGKIEQQLDRVRDKFIRPVGTD
mgnify:CR=1 FL=1